MAEKAPEPAGTPPLISGPDMPSARKVIDAILERPDCIDEGSVASELLLEFQKGFPVSELRALVLSNNEKAIRIATFVASEMGHRAAPILDIMVKLLHYPNKFIRSDAICSVLTCADRNNRREIAAVISMLEDSDWPIRWKTMEFLSLASLGQLKGALEYFQANEPQAVHVEGLRWLTGACEHNIDEITTWLMSHSPVNRKYAVAAAARIASVNAKPLMLASLAEDDDVKRFAISMLEMNRERSPGNT